MSNFRPQDLTLLETRGVSVDEAEAQISRFINGFPFLKIESAATVGRGIKRLSAAEEDVAIERWKEYLQAGGEVLKFVPASGAASRMFKALFSYIDGDTDELKPGSPVAQLIENLDKLPFLAELQEAVKKMHGTTLADLVEQKRNRDIIAAIVKPEGMNYGNLPKGLLKFHSYADGSRTPLEEHLTEGAQTAANSSGVVNLHFTVSEQHVPLFKAKLAEAIPAAEARTGLKFDVTMSTQKASTDTIAVNPDNTPFLQDDHLLFRPGGHGALIENLNDIDSAVVFIKNIDNVVPDSRRDITVRYKQVIGGVLMQARDRIVEAIAKIDSGDYTDADLAGIETFMKDTLCFHDTRLASLDKLDKANYLRGKLDRPLRVCGMVKNEGEPGGGPFITYNADGSTSPQILESTQIDPAKPEYAEMLKTATHFNPVDLVCCIKRTDGSHYNLPDYVDADTGFISSKSAGGRELRALELPGLWNGAMSDWNTIFVEVPIETFNPVKVVNDLLRPAHQ
ncbi:MAG: DUF4301 family protein [Muribaculaceae bacterium]|nr:DUF4301 family protein [Muribaculaceae bacterium]